MDLVQVQSDLAKGGLLIDVRSPEEYAEGHVKDALLIPHTQFFSADIPAEKEASIYLYCKMGPRAEFTAGVLRERGFTKVINLGGLDDMEALGFKFEK
ncbi:rhodanese-like domain-containing protein [Streptococcus vestibularis]|uniref:Thiosulfate sulfurtransferase PspE n=1 Tax=Streptococcus vestibularis TaxID=1343 RepID=A0A564TM22_STRVE|nr:rhodanese-like domain-containing protein [Streptococcus vestibularis]VUX08313.1 Thiosulfate sulfurtransferase PspE precursor [Streptococcus vestibularis]